MSKKERYWFEESWVPVPDRRQCFEDGGCQSCPDEDTCSNLRRAHVREERLNAGGDPDFLAALVDIEALHKNKSSTYGTNEDSFANFTDVATITNAAPERYALLRIIEKCSRAIHQIDAGNPEDVKEYPDIAGLALCCEALKRKTAP